MKIFAITKYNKEISLLSCGRPKNIFQIFTFCFQSQIFDQIRAISTQNGNLYFTVDTKNLF